MACVGEPGMVLSVMVCCVPNSSGRLTGGAVARAWAKDALRCALIKARCSVCSRFPRELLPVLVPPACVCGRGACGAPGSPWSSSSSWSSGSSRSSCSPRLSSSTPISCSARSSCSTGTNVLFRMPSCMEMQCATTDSQHRGPATEKDAIRCD